MVTLLAQYDPVLKELVNKPEGSVRYLSPQIQNELISLLGSKMREHLLSEIRTAPFFAIIGDTTIDMSKIDQYSNCIRYLHFENSTKSVEVRETFLGFYALQNQSAEGFVDLVCGLLKDASIDINKCRGQGYDGASVMSGAYSGVQKRIQSIVPSAAYVHCICHRLNLVLGDAAESCAEMKSSSPLFSQCMYSLEAVHPDGLF
jgi:hypothetical protein